MIEARENFLNALSCKRTERIPFVFVIDCFNYPDSLPPDLMEPFDAIRIQRYLGGDLLERLAPAPIIKENQLLRHSCKDLENGNILQEWEMPEGKISGIYKRSVDAKTMYLEKKGITDCRGYEVLMAMINDTELCIDTEGVERTKARLEEIGDDGILYSVGASTPIMDLARQWVGLEKFIYDLHDYPDLVKKTMDVMAEKVYQEYELLAATTPAKVIVYYDDVNSLYVSKDMFRKYALPVHRNIADICHERNKLLVCHTCGNIKTFLRLFMDTGIDAIDWVTPPDTGDVVFSEAQALFRNRIAIMGTVIPAVMRFGSPDAVEQHIHEILEGVDIHHGFVFMIPAPIDSPLQNIERVKQVIVRDYL